MQRNVDFFLKIGQQLGPYYNAKRAVLEIKTTLFIIY